MSISKKEEDGQEILIIKDQPQLTDNTLGALIEFIDDTEGKIPFIQQYLDNLEAEALMNGMDRDQWEQEFEYMVYLREFLKRIRRHQDPQNSL